MEPIIKVDNVSMCFNLSKEKHESLKEYFLAMVQGRLQYDEFYALKDVSLDIMHIWSVFITALLYFSAIFYDPTQMTFSIGGFNMQQIIKLNPMYWYITGFRRTLMWGIPLDINMFLVCGLCALISMLIGVQMFRKTQDRFVLHI